MNNKYLLTCCILSGFYLQLIVKQGEMKEVLYCDVQIYISWHHYKYKALAIRAGIDNVYLDNLCKSDTLLNVCSETKHMKMDIRWIFYNIASY